MILTSLNVLVGLCVGAFALSNIVLPFTVTLPTLRWMRKEGLLAKEVPGYLVFSPPIVWIVLSVVVFWIYRRFIPNHEAAFFVGLCCSIPVPIIGTFKGMRRQDISGDFLENYGEYVDQEKIRNHPLFRVGLGKEKK